MPDSSQSNCAELPRNHARCLLDLRIAIVERRSSSRAVKQAGVSVGGNQPPRPQSGFPSAKQGNRLSSLVFPQPHFEKSLSLRNYCFVTVSSRLSSILATAA